MVGQDNLLKKLDSFTLATLPHTMLFLGEAGSGRKTIINYLATRMNLPVVDISKPTNTDKDKTLTSTWQDTIVDSIIDYLQNPVKTLYILDIDTISDKDQNKFLKFIEEPGNNAYICLIASNEAKILPTIYNRCQVFRMEQYTVAQLRASMGLAIIDNDIIFNICTTPGQVQAANTDYILQVYDLCCKILEKISTNVYNNFLSIYNKAYIDDESSFFLFFKTLKYVAFKTYLESQNDVAFSVYRITNDYTRLFNVSNLLTAKAKEHFIMNFLSKLWREIHGFTRA